MGREQHTDATGRVWGGKKEKKWIHDMYNEEEQKPKEDVSCETENTEQLISLFLDSRALKPLIQYWKQDLKQDLKQD